MFRIAATLTALSGALLLLPACVVHPGTYHGSATVVTPAVVTTDVIVPVAPPPPRYVRTRPACPSPDHVWIDGYWRWDGHTHIWVGGRWDRRPYSGASWNSGRWDRRGSGYIWIKGGWHGGSGGSHRDSRRDSHRDSGRDSHRDSGRDSHRGGGGYR